MGSVVDETNLMKDEDIAFDDDDKSKDLAVEFNEIPAEKPESGTISVKETNEFPAEKEENETVSVKETNEVLSDDQSTKNLSQKQTNEILLKKSLTIVFVLGGPGGGKSTECAKLAKEIGYTHLSSGDILRKAMKSDPENGPMIEGMLKEGKSVPPDVTMIYLQNAINESGNDKFLLDGFPRDEEIHSAFLAAIKTEPELVLFFDCSEEEREQRILSRNQGRVDDNPDSLRKRFKYFEENTLPIVDYYRSKGKVTMIDAAKPMEEVYETLKGLLSPKLAVEVVEVESAAQLEVGISKLIV